MNRPSCTPTHKSVPTTGDHHRESSYSLKNSPQIKLSSDTHQSHSFLSPPLSPPPVNSSQRPNRLGLYFKELVADWFIHNTTTPSDPLYVHLPITPPGTSQTLHMPSPHLGINPSIMAMVPPPPVPLAH